MRIASYGHSCLLVEAASGSRILVDPGNYSSIPDSVLNERLDGVLITHAHEDHTSLPLITRIRASHPEAAIYASGDVVTKLAEAGIAATDHTFSSFEIAGIAIEVLAAQHEAILGDAPINTAYRIDNELVITGDSASPVLDIWSGTRVLALPTIAPWTTELLQASFLERIKPEVFFGVHDGFLIDSYRERSGARFAALGVKYGMSFKKLSTELGDI